MAEVTFEHVTKRFTPQMTAVKDFNLEVRDKEFMVLVGPSGCGKSTALRMLAGLEEITEGVIRIDDRVVNDVPPRDRDIAMVFQSYALYPHKTVYDNMAFGLQVRRMPKPEIDKRVRDAADTLELTALLARKPRQLSGGQRQRVALGRAIVRNPKVFLLDEPLSNLDAKLRVQTRIELQKQHQALGSTFIYVTHDQVEAMTMGDRIAVMKDGLLHQVGTPDEIYDRPANLFVAGFIGSPAMNLMSGPIVEGGVTIGGFDVPIKREVLAKAVGEKTLTLGIRPESFTMADLGIGIDVAVVEELGADAYVYGTLAGLADDAKLNAQQIVARISSRRPPERGSTVKMGVDTEHIHVFSDVTQERLS
jgi:multiple sugar transport system ATP-binding protein